MNLKRPSICILILFAILFSSGRALAQKTVHVLVALCDNVHQGIVPVSRALGDGANPASNLYWGAAYGVKTYMRKQSGWKLAVSQPNPTGDILERIILVNDGLGVTMVADAYKGSAIKKCTETFLDYCSGKNSLSLAQGKKSIKAGAGAQLIVYVGHNGLMDFNLSSLPKGPAENTRQAALFACQSKRYFPAALKAGGAYPLIWTTGNLAPEAYTLNALVTGWAKGKDATAVRDMVADAYNKYQKCGQAGARRLFATGW